MKIKFIFILCLIFVSFLSAKNKIMLNANMQADTIDVNYDFGISVNLQDSTYDIYSRFKKELEGRKQYIAIETRLRYIKQYYMLTANYISRERVNMKIIDTDMRVKYDIWSLGVAELYDYDNFYTKVVFGTIIKKKVTFFMLPVEMNFQSASYFPGVVNTMKFDLDVSLQTGVINNIFEVLNSNKRIPKVILGAMFESYFYDKFDFEVRINLGVAW